MSPARVNLAHSAAKRRRRKTFRLPRPGASDPQIARFRASHPRASWLLRAVEPQVVRLIDRYRWPRAIWNPVYRPVLFRNDADRLKYHDETSRALRTSVFTILVFSFFCVLTLAAPDAQVVSAAAQVKVPFADVEIAFSSFLFVGPLVLLGFLIYQQIFIAHLRLTDPPPAEAQLPILFNLPYRSARAISFFLFYWIGPLVLFVFLRKALPRPEAPFLLTLFVATTCWSLLLQIRRCAPSIRGRVVPWLFAAMVFVLAVYADKVAAFAAGRTIAHSYAASAVPFLSPLFELPFRRELNLSAADLSKQDLSGFDLSGANLRAANLSGANLDGTILERADLRNSDLRGTSRQGTRFQGALMAGAKR